MYTLREADNKKDLNFNFHLRRLNEMIPNIFVTYLSIYWPSSDFYLSEKWTSLNMYTLREADNKNGLNFNFHLRRLNEMIPDIFVD